MATAPEQIAELLDQETLGQLDASVSGLDTRQLWWASGYLAGLAAGGSAAVLAPRERSAAPAATASDAETWTILYATETGNSRRVAKDLAERARAAGLTVKTADLRDYRPRQLQHETQVLIVTATHGLGDAPDGSEEFFEYWLGEQAPRLEKLRYSVLALGDSSYDEFCRIGQDIDERLAALGAKRIHARVDCDVDFQAAAGAWSEAAIAAAVALQPPAAPVTAARGPRLVAVSAPAWSRERPYLAERLAEQKITGRHSSKDVRHIELALDEDALRYQPGDSLGVIPENPPHTVQALIELTGLLPDAAVQVDGREMPLAEALGKRLEITQASRGFMQTYAAASGDADLAALANETDLREWLAERQIIDIVAAFPHRLPAQALADTLRRLTPRLYSIASSPEATPGEAHLTVRLIDYTAHGRRHWGAASSYLTRTGNGIPVFVESNERFRLPDDDTAVIMIGPGTGVAPFRAFMQQREVRGARGANWLFFGDRNRESDFLYQLEWLRWRKNGLLTRLDVAFSRDQIGKTYVQHRIREQSRELYRWLDDGAALYVCGDALHMAPDVHAALREAVAGERHCSAEDAESWLRELKRAGRYSKDVY